MFFLLSRFFAVFTKTSCVAFYNLESTISLSKIKRLPLFSAVLLLAPVVRHGLKEISAGALNSDFTVHETNDTRPWINRDGSGWGSADWGERVSSATEDKASVELFNSALYLRRQLLALKSSNLPLPTVEDLLNDSAAVPNVLLWDTPGSKADRIRKDLIKMFAEMGLKITFQTNLKVADFLDVTLNLSTRSFYPFRKLNDRQMYIHKLLNYPPNIIKNLPASISRRLTHISSDNASFANAKPLYDKCAEGKRVL